MSAEPKLSRDEFIAQMRAKMEAMLGQVADAINDAPPGHIISGSEEQVRDLFADLRHQAAANLKRTAQVQLSGETLRVLVETEGKRVLQAQRSGRLPLDWSAADCKTQEKTTRIYVGSDGVMVPTVTETEKTSRRKKVKE